MFVFFKTIPHNHIRYDEYDKSTADPAVSFTTHVCMNM